MKNLTLLIIFSFICFSSLLKINVYSFKSDTIDFNNFEYDYVLNLNQIKNYNFSNKKNKKEYENIKKINYKLKFAIKKSYKNYKNYEKRRIALYYSNFTYYMDMYFYFLKEKEKYPNDIEVNYFLVETKKYAINYLEKLRNYILKITF